MFETGLNINRKFFSGIELQQKLLFLPHCSVQHLGAFKRDSFNLSDPAELESNLRFQTSDLRNRKVVVEEGFHYDFRQLTYEIVK